MSSNLLLSMLAILFLVQCENYKSKKESLNKLSRNNILKYHEEGRLNFDNDIVYYNGILATESELVLGESRAYCYDYFVDKKGKIVLVDIRQTSYEDDITEILKSNIGYDPTVGIPLMDINCDSLGATIKEISMLIPKEVKHLVDLDSMQLDTFDYSDYMRIKIVSVDKHCGINTLTERGEKSAFYFWNMVHHNESEVIAYYYNYFDDLVKKGHMHPEMLALSTDRLLIFNEYKQAFGSQISDGPPIVRNKDSVDVRRAKFGMEPLYVYLDRSWGIPWPAPKNLESK